MSKEKLGQESAFPEIYENIDGTRQPLCGMNKRFYAACCAMQGLLSGGNFAEGTSYNPTITELAYKIVDDLLEKEND